MFDDQAVVYVEDEDLLGKLAVATLEDAGFEVVLTENGNAALEILDDNADPFCAVITDVNLGPGPDGWSIAMASSGRSRSASEPGACSPV